MCFDYLIVLQDLSDIGIAIELMHIQPPGRHFDSSLFYRVGQEYQTIVLYDN